jgi:catechol 2,3-dioxygenase-like lactoylglutathione lyase family enzyme
MAPSRIRFLYTGIEVRNLERSLRFYLGLGFRLVRRGSMEHGGLWVHLRLPRQRQRLELNYYAPGNPYRRPYRHGSELDHLGFRVDDPEAWGRLAVRLGGRRVARIRESREWLVYVSDPDGVWLEFFGPPPMPRTRPRRRVRRPAPTRGRSRS